MAKKTLPAAATVLALAACLGSSPVRNHTMIFVSTSLVATPGFQHDPRVHVGEGTWFAGAGQAAKDVRRPGRRKCGCRFEQHAFAGLFHGEARSRIPAPGLPDDLGQNDLALGGDGGREISGFGHRGFRQTAFRQDESKMLRSFGPIKEDFED